MRSFLLVFLCFCLTFSGTAVATPMAGMTTQSMVAGAAMDEDCPDMLDTVAMAADHAHGEPAGDIQLDCCKGGVCQCVSAHGAPCVAMSPGLSRPVPVMTTVVHAASASYSSPALARLVRPPIS